MFLHSDFHVIKNSYISNRIEKLLLSLKTIGLSENLPNELGLGGLKP